jgi:hypothetical protein
VTEELLRREAARRRRAAEILADLDLRRRWARFGVTHVVGATAYGLMVACDIDLEITCPRPRVEMGFAVVADLARRPDVWKVRFSNELDGPDQGLYWQLRLRSDDEIWKLDMWLLADDHPGPQSADLVDPMRRALTDETRVAILALKERLHAEGVPSIDVYRAVLDAGVRSESEFRAWHAQNPSVGLAFWRPG